MANDLRARLLARTGGKVAPAVKAKAAPVVEDEEVEEEEEVVVAKPKVGVKPKPGVKVKAPVVEVEEEEEIEEEAEEEAEEEEVVVAPKAKPGVKAKPIVKAKAKTPVVEVEEEEEEEIEEAEEEAEEEEVVVAPKAKPGVKAKAKPAPEVEEAKTKAKPKTKALFAPKTPTIREEKVYGPGSWLPRHELMSRFKDYLVAVDPSMEHATPNMLDNLIANFEAFILETLQDHDVRLFNVKNKRSHVQARVYPPMLALEKVKSPYHTLVHAHETMRFVILPDEREVNYGTTDDDGNFVEGRFDAKGNFEEGTWVDKAADEFTPKVKKAATVKPKTKK